eukprot:gene5812-6099_t
MRSLFVLIFLGSAAHKFHTAHVHNREDASIMAYMTPKLNSFFGKVHDLTGFEIPIDESMHPQILMVAAALEAVGGLLVMFNIKDAFMGHNFWELPEGPARDMDMAHFMKNISIFGALLIYLTSSTTKKNKNKDVSLKWE